MLEKIAGNPLTFVSRLCLVLVLLWVVKGLHGRYSLIWVVLSPSSFSLINLFLGWAFFLLPSRRPLGATGVWSSSLLLLAQGFFDGWEQFSLEIGCNIGSSAGHILHSSGRELFHGTSKWSDSIQVGMEEAEKSRKESI